MIQSGGIQESGQIGMARDRGPMEPVRTDATDTPS